MAFATVQELANYLQATIPNSAAHVALDMAEGRIVAATGQMFTYTEDDTITLSGSWGEVLELPQWPVHSVSLVETTHWGETVSTGQVAGTNYMLQGNRLHWMGGYARIGGSPALPYIGAGWPRTVRITYTHGYQTIPRDVWGCTLMLAAESYSSPDGVHYESIDDYAWRRGDADATPGQLALKGLVRRYGMRSAMVRLS
jgi:hypothetical protein